MDTPALLRLGYTPRDLERVVERAGGRFEHPDDVRCVIDSFGYLDDWRENYQIQSVRASLHSERITCIDAAILSYGLLDLLPHVRRRLLAIHRRDQHGEECGHCVTLWWTESGCVGAFSKSSFAGLGHREATFKDEFAIAKSFAKAYVDMGITPLYFGVTTLEEVSHGFDWRFSADNLNELSERLKERYEYAFELATSRRSNSPPDDVRSLLARMADPAEAARPALTFYRGRARMGALTYGELVHAVERLAGGLASSIRRGDRVAVLSPNRLEIPVLVLALLRLGAVVVPLNPTATSEDWSYALQHSAACGVIGTRELLDRVTTPVKHWVIDDLGALEGEAPTVVDLAESLAIILYTSGTTGQPKGVALSQRAALWNGAAMARNFGFDRTTQLAVLPLYHAHAFGFGLMSALQTFGHLVFCERLDPFAWAEVIRIEKVEVTSVVPNLLPMLLQVKVRRDRVPSLRCMLVSSAPLTADMARRFEAETGIPLVHGWGLSEVTNFACCTSPQDDTEAHRELLLEAELPSIGPALDGVDVAVTDGEGTPLGEGERGELCIRSPSVMLGYYRDEEATRRAIRNGWLLSGDEGFWQMHRGRKVFTVTGRLKEIIIRDAEKYSPLALERALVAAIPELSDSLVVVGFAHALHGEEIGAYIELPELGEELTACLTRVVAALPVDSRPKVILYGEASIPRTHTGKIQRRKLVPLFEPYRDCRGALVIARA